MGFFKRLFEGGSAEATPEELEARESREAERKFQTLKDDGVRAKNMGEIAYARKCLESALAIREEAEAMSYLAEVCLRQGDHAAAVPLLEKLNENAEAGIAIKLLLAQCYEKTGKADEAISLCNEALALNAQEPLAHYVSALASRQKKDWFAAIASLTLALQSAPEYAEATLLRAQVLAEMGQHAEALADVNALIEADKLSEEVLLLKGELECRMGNFDAANAAYDAVLELNPFCREVSLGRADVLEAQDLHGEAIDALSAAIEEYSDFGELYLRRGALRLALGDKEGAAADMKRALELEPKRAAELNGEYQSLENRVAEQFRALNPYGF